MRGGQTKAGPIHEMRPAEDFAKFAVVISFAALGTKL